MGVAQMVEYALSMRGARGSIPLTYTSLLYALSMRGARGSIPLTYTSLLLLLSLSLSLSLLLLSLHFITAFRFLPSFACASNAPFYTHLA